MGWFKRFSESLAQGTVGGDTAADDDATLNFFAAAKVFLG